MQEIEQVARKYAVKNAHDYGKADAGSVMNKVISKSPEAKADMRALASLVAKIVSDVNSLDKSELDGEYAKYGEEFGSEEDDRAKRTSRPKFELPEAEMGKIVTRFAPEPSGYMHIGHTKAAILAETFAKQYEGKLYLHFDDTNPEKETQDFVDQFHRDLDWLGMKFDKEYYSSDHIEHVYAFARKLLAGGKAYVCTCDGETVKKNRFNGIACEHLSREAKDNTEMFEAMLKGEYEEGGAIVRFKYDMANPNTTLRDPTMLRIKRATHYRQGDRYIVWPSYYFNTPIIDSAMGVTDAMRSKEYEQSEALYKQILISLGLRVPRIYAFSRLNIKGNITSKRKLRALFEEGNLSGYDDPRLMTIAALRRRGVMPQAIRELILSMGFSKSESRIDQSALFAENRKIIDPIAKHLFFVADPVKVVVGGAKQKEVRLKLNPQSPGMTGVREYELGDVFYIDRKDSDSIKAGDHIRLKDLFDITVRSFDGSAIEAEASGDGQKGRIIHWVPGTAFKECSVKVPGELLKEDEGYNPDSLKVETGYVEGYAGNLKKGDIVQFERFGYSILDDKESMGFIFISK